MFLIESQKVPPQATPSFQWKLAGSAMWNEASVAEFCVSLYAPGTKTNKES